MKRIMVVDDEAMFGMILGEFLGISGYQVAVFENPQKALDTIVEGNGKIDVLLSDITMPEMSGWDLSRMVKAADPKIKIILMTGYAKEDLHSEGVSFDEFLTKPFQLFEVKEKIEKVLAQI